MHSAFGRIEALFNEIEDDWVEVAIQQTLDELSKGIVQGSFGFALVESAKFISNFIRSIETNFDVFELDEDVSNAISKLDNSQSPVLLICGGELEEGLNLHGPNRTVVNFDIPLNPNRIEQRIGRVDRFGSMNFQLLSVRNVSNELESKIHEINESVLGIFEHSVASLQFSIERFYSELLTNLAFEGTVALMYLKTTS